MTPESESNPTLRRCKRRPDAGVLPATLSVPQFAAFIGVGLTTANRLLSTKQVPSLKIGKRRLIVKADAQAWLNRMTEQAA